MVATMTFIRQGDLEDTYALATQMMHHPHDLMHKAIGWMLREAGKKDPERLYDYVDSHRSDMPRTMLRYAIEKFDQPTRQWLMRKDPV
jgi:3-methyladenine DNA glycosylase AlkD